MPLYAPPKKKSKAIIEMAKRIKFPPKNPKLPNGEKLAGKKDSLDTNTPIATKN